MSVNNQHYLVVTALGSDQIGVLEAFTKTSKQCGCNIIESKLAKVGEECSLLLHLSGTWNTVAKLEAALPPLAEQFGLSIHSKRTLPRKNQPALPYQVQVIAEDRQGILNELALFFVQQGISLDQMDCETYDAKNHTTMTSISFIINIPVKQHIASIRERFMVYCEDRNLDAVIEPYKSL
ncbi:MAG: glycine cleavage system protein R [Gammaproteobacteria bacterium]|jgi:glycine cleavage system transcriptional repressor|nr:glycine cleavage system protein R [Gammaproteobacteria bacterium]